MEGLRRSGQPLTVIHDWCLGAPVFVMPCRFLACNPRMRRSGPSRGAPLASARGSAKIAAMETPAFTGLERSNGAIDEWLLKSLGGGTRWFEGPGWEAVAAESPHRAEIAAAAAALKSVFPWRWLSENDFARLQHPVVRQQMWRGSMEKVQTAGIMLARYPEIARALVGRLRDPKRYGDHIAELLVGFVLAEVDAELTFEPARRGTAGPDLIARWGDLEVSVEVKHPNISAHALAASNVEVLFLVELQRHLTDVRPTEAAWLTFELNPGFAGRLDPRCDKDREALRCRAREVAADLKHRLPVPTRAALIRISDLASFEIRPGLPGPPAFQVQGAGMPADAEREIAKLSRLLQKTSDQLKNARGLRITALHIERDRLISNYVPAIERILREQQWAKSIDGVLLVGCLDGMLAERSELICGPDPSPEFFAFARHLNG